MGNGDTINVGVLGLGFMGATHFRAYEAARERGVDCDIVAVCDRRETRRQGAIESVGNIVANGDRLFEPGALRSYATPAEFVADPDVQAVSVCTYTDSHVELAIAALEAGKHVLVEKPVALTGSAIQQLRRVADDRPQRCMPAMCMRFWPEWAWLRARVEDGTLGAVVRAAFVRTGSPPAWATDFYSDRRRSGSALFDLHIHDVDFLFACFGAPDQVVSEGSETHVKSRYDYSNGPVVTAEGGWLAPGTAFRMEFEVEFEAATARFAFGAETPLTLEEGGVVRPIPCAQETGYEAEIRSFLACVADPGQELPATLADAEAVTALLAAECASLERGEAVRCESSRLE